MKCKTYQVSDKKTKTLKIRTLDHYYSLPYYPASKN